MQHFIAKWLNRLSLHDSTLESYVRRGTDVELTFDWAKLTNSAEEGVAGSVILGRTIVSLTGIATEKFSVFEANKNLLITAPNFDALGELDLLVSNELDDLTQVVALGGLLREAAGSTWAEWQATFTLGTVSWHSFLTETEWKAGKLPTC